MTAYSSVTTLRFEEANISLGDELRGARASTGRSLTEIERELRIKSKYILAIENGDLSALPGKVYTDGFLRSYARYLELDPETVVRRFHAEHGIRPAGRDAAAQDKRAPETFVDPLAAIAREKSRPNYGAAFGRALVLLWPLALLAALGFGAWYAYDALRQSGAIAQDFGTARSYASAPPPAAAAARETVVVGDSSSATLPRPDSLDYAEAGATPYWRAAPPELEPDEVPISAIDAATSGVFATRPGGLEVSWAAPWGVSTGNDLRGSEDARSIAAEARAALTVDFLATPPTEKQGPEPAAPATRFALRAEADSWVRVRNASGATVFTGIIESGAAYDIPEDEGLDLHVGNAGGLYIDVGAESFGPLGGDGKVIRDIELTPKAVRDRFSSLRTVANAAGR